MTNQLTLLFLVVVISGALCTVEDYVIMSQCAHNKAIYLAAEGTVSVTDISQTQNITIVGRPDFVNNNFKIALYAKETQRYLCFNDHWKLVGMKELQDTCYFNEAIVHGYFVFRSVVESQRRIGFTQRGRAVGPKKTVNDACYMFTKIPTDQFFHQHNHYSSLSAPKSTKTPKQEHSSAGHFGRGSGAGSGGGRPKPNRHRNQHRNEDGELVNKPHSKKTKLHGGNRKRQHQQRLQQMRGSGNGSGASSSDPKNSTYLNSSRQNVELSQYGGHNHTGKHHNHSQPQAHHQTRHHHTSDARRHHHDAKQKAHHRARATSTSPEGTTTTTTAATPHSSEPQTSAVTLTKNKLASNAAYGDIKPTSVVQSVTTVVAAASATTLSNHDVVASTIAHKRKGRRRKPHRKHTFHKSDQHQETGHSVDASHGRHGHGHATLPAYEDEDYMTTDLTTWINNDMSALGSFASVKPTSASLPSWETWYPSSSTPLAEDSSDYSASSVASYEKDDVVPNWEAASSASALASVSPLSPSLDDISKNPLPFMPLPLPTSAFSASYTEHKVEEVIAPTTVRTTTTTTTATATTTTTNTSSFRDKERWLQRHHHEAAKAKEDSIINTSKLDSANAVEELNITAGDYENATFTSTANSESFEVSESNTESALDAADSTQLSAVEYKGEELLSRAWAPTKSTESHEPSTKIHASPESGGKVMTDYLYATRTAPLAGGAVNHKLSRHRHNEHGTISQKHQHNSNNGPGVGQRSHHNKKPIANASSREAAIPPIVSTTTTTSISGHLPISSPSLNNDQAMRLDALLTADKNFNAKQSHNTVTDPDATDTANTLPPIFSSTAVTSVASSPTSPSASASTTTRKTLRKSTQRLLATPFHQLTYVRNEAGDIDIDSLDNISIYPDLLDNDNVNDDDVHKSGPGGTSRFTMISGYLPTSATATLPESIRIAKIKINRERKRMLRLRNIGGYSA